MKIIKGNSSLDMTSEELLEITNNYNKVHIDIGTGDGRFIYKSAQKNPDIFYIGVDPSHTQLEVYSKKSTRDKLENVLFVVGSIEVFPKELMGIADSVSVLLPWGTLLQTIVLGSPAELITIYMLLKNEGTLDLLFGYAHDTEPSEVERLNLNNLSLEYIKTAIMPKFLEIGFSGGSINEVQKDELKTFETTWSKKLAFGNDRPLFRVKLKKEKKITTTNSKETTSQEQ